ncbi:MAG: response regulator [Flavobacteriales bacterium]|nr:response regulator [Flavobacteriales bacterium]
MKKQGRILIVDDEPNILLSLDFLMRRGGYEVFIARNGTEAMELLDKHSPDLVVLDIMMPDVDGYYICRHIKTSGKHPSCKVVFLSAKSKESDIKTGMDMGADAYLTKPFSTRQLMQKVEELL